MANSADLYFLTGKFLIGGLFFVRVLGFFTSGPVFRNTNIPMEMKVLLGAIITLSITNAFWLEQPEIQFHLWNIVLLALKEFMVGIALGLATNSVFYAARFAGGIIDFEMGYQTSLLFSKDQSAPTLIGELYELIAVMLFLIINGHHFLIESLYASVKAVPIGTFAVTDSTIQLLIRYSTTIFIIGIKMAAPVLIALFLTNLSLALLARIAPQTNIFILSFQLKVAVGLLVLLATVPLFVMVAKYSLQTMETEALRIILSLNPGRV